MCRERARAWREDSQIESTVFFDTGRKSIDSKREGSNSWSDGTQFQVEQTWGASLKRKLSLFWEAQMIKWTKHAHHKYLEEYAGEKLLLCRKRSLYMMERLWDWTNAIMYIFSITLVIHRYIVYTAYNWLCNLWHSLSGVEFRPCHGDEGATDKWNEDYNEDWPPFLQVAKVDVVNGW